MATLTIRKLDDKVHARLRVQAAINGRSVEAEVREILLKAASRPKTPRKPPKKAMEALERFRESIRKANGGKMPTGVVDEFLRNRRRMWGEE